MSTQCIACGMPMEKPEDHASGDPSKNFCKHCSRPDGEMKSYDEVLNGMAGFMMQSQGLSEEPARQAAKEMMTRLPAWKDR